MFVMGLLTVFSMKTVFGNVFVTGAFLAPNDLAQGRVPRPARNFIDPTCA